MCVCGLFNGEKKEVGVGEGFSPGDREGVGGRGGAKGGGGYGMGCNYYGRGINGVNA